MFYMSGRLYQQIDFKHAMLLRVYQSAGLAFLFVPINTIVYAGVPPEKNNAVAGIVNLSRNMGGDIGIAFVTTMIARSTQAHQNVLVAHASAYDRSLAQTLDRIAVSLQHAGTSAPEAARRAMGVVYRQLSAQAATLAYLDVLRVLSIITVLMIPTVMLTRRPTMGRAAGGH
jgi:DHA2 family multidrug resistance protein